MRADAHTKQTFIEKALKVHGDRYDYSSVNYTGYKNKITIICKTHGPFEQRAGHHLQGQNCKYCGYGEASNKLRKFLSPAEVLFLRENYVKRGAAFCAESLNTTKDCIYHAVQKLKIKKNNSKLNHAHIPGTLWSNLISNAKVRNLAFDITPDDIYEQYVSQDKRCALTGRAIVLSFDAKLNTASVDRIDSALGYMKSNIQIVHKQVNQCKMDLSDSGFYFLCKDVYLNLKSKFEPERS